MLKSLHIRNYVLIDSLDVSFQGGLNIITGSTGAGKSILLGALSLLTGAKAEASLISQGAESCVVEGEFSLPDDSLRALLEDGGVEWSEDGSLIVRRVVYNSGRSRSFVNDSPVNLGLLEECAGQLADIHSQHNNLILTDKRYQLRVLDHFAGNGTLLQKCAEQWRSLQALRIRKKETEEKLARLRVDKDYNQAQFQQLDSARLRDGELSELEAEQKQLANAEGIKTALETALACFDISEEQSVDSSLKEAARQLDKISAYLPEVKELSARIHSARIELEDIRDTVDSAFEKVDVSGGRLQAVEDRMGLLYNLFQKFGCRTEQELIALREEYSAKLFDSTALEEEADDLQKRIAGTLQAYSETADELHGKRAAAAPGFSAEILKSLRFLELERSIFEARIMPADEGPTGTDSVLFEFSSTGKNPDDVAKCASGGEISRIMLSLKAEMARFEGMPTMIFDEIDTGVSGSAADKMGRMICDMGRDMQVMAITHLPQVAAKGGAHFVVEKCGDASNVRRIEGHDRVMEIARLLSGSTITPQAIANAESLLG